MQHISLDVRLEGIKIFALILFCTLHFCMLATWCQSLWCAVTTCKHWIGRRELGSQESWIGPGIGGDACDPLYTDMAYKQWRCTLWKNTFFMPFTLWALQLVISTHDPHPHATSLIYYSQWEAVLHRCNGWGVALRALRMGKTSINQIDAFFLHSSGTPHQQFLPSRYLLQWEPSQVEESARNDSIYYIIQLYIYIFLAIEYIDW